MRFCARCHSSRRYVPYLALNAHVQAVRPAAACGAPRNARSRVSPKSGWPCTKGLKNANARVCVLREFLHFLTGGFKSCTYVRYLNLGPNHTRGLALSNLLVESTAMFPPRLPALLFAFLVPLYPCSIQFIWFCNCHKMHTMKKKKSRHDLILFATHTVKHEEEKVNVTEYFLKCLGWERIFVLSAWSQQELVFSLNHI